MSARSAVSKVYNFNNVFARDGQTLSGTELLKAPNMVLKTFLAKIVKIQQKIIFNTFFTSICTDACSCKI